MINFSSFRSQIVVLLFLVGGFVHCRQGAAPPVNRSLRVPAREVFLLPPGYLGPFIAIYGEKNAVEPRWSGDTAMFFVGPSGVIRIKYQEPSNATITSHAYVGSPSRVLPNYPTCADMRVHVTDQRVGICWLDFAVHLERTPDHVVAVITDWNSIPKNFERTTAVYDSVLLGGKGLGKRGWDEPRDLKRKRADLRSMPLPHTD